MKQNRDSVASNDSFNDSPLPLNPASAQQLAKVAAETEELALFSTRYSMSNGWKMENYANIISAGGTPQEKESCER